MVRENSVCFYYLCIKFSNIMSNSIDSELNRAYGLIASMFFIDKGHSVNLSKDSKLYYIVVSDGDHVVNSWLLSSDEIRLIAKAMRKMYVAHADTVIIWNEICSKVML